MNNLTSKLDNCQVQTRSKEELRTGSIEFISGGHEFIDVSPTGRERPWREMKRNNSLLKSTYFDISQKSKIYLLNPRTEKYYRSADYYRRMAERLNECASTLIFSKVKDSKRLRLTKANFCRCRLCPTCIWRRSLKIAGQLRSVLDYEESQKEHAYLFITLTVPNVKTEELKATLTKMHKAWSNSFVRYKEIEKAVKGWFRSTEITYNIQRDDWHPHFHCVLQVNKSYFTDGYITHEKWLEYWQKAMKDDSIKMVNVKRIKPKGEQSYIHAICEAAKYSVKPTDYIDAEDIEWTNEQVILLDSLLKDRRFVGWGGSFKEARKALDMDDAEDESSDLIHNDLEEQGTETEQQLYVKWLDQLQIYTIVAIGQ